MEEFYFSKDDEVLLDEEVCECFAISKMNDIEYIKRMEEAI